MKDSAQSWWVLIGLFFIYAISNGIILNTLPIFFPSLMDSFGWNQEQVSRPPALMYSAIAFFALGVGFLLDKYKPKMVMVAGVAIILLALFLYSQVTSLLMLTLVYLLFALGLTLGGIVSSMYLVSKWFEKNRGIAVGIFLMASSIGGAVFPRIAGSTIALYGWQNAAIILGVIAGIFTLVPVLLLVKNPPEEIIDKSIHTNENIINKGVTLPEALRTPNFYLLLFVTATLWFCITSVINHQALYFTKDLQLNAIKVASVMSVFFVSSFLGKALFGYLSDKYSKKNIMLLAVINLLIGSVILKLIPSNPEIYVNIFALVYGVGFSGAFTMIQVVIADFYGGTSYGKILGVFTMIDTLAGSAGIALMGKIRVSTESYDAGFNMLIGLCLIASFCVLFIRKKREQQ